jgi:Flp pilus assembly protein TadB
MIVNGDDLLDGCVGMILWLVAMATGMPAWGALAVVVAAAYGWLWCKLHAGVRQRAVMLDALPTVAPALLATVLASV